MIKKDSIFEGMKYTVSYPSSYSKGKQYPIILFLHGAGSRGSDISLLKSNPYFLITDKIKDFPFITIAPLCHKNTWFDLFETLKRFVLYFTESDYVDINRVYVMGASMGGYATWQLAMSMPERFAAVVPICGGGMYWNADRLVNVPVWAFHGEKDAIVFVDESKKMVKAVNNTGGKAKLTIYPENGHDAWSDTYANRQVYSWLLTNTNIKEDTNDTMDHFQGSISFG
ncbi:MAG: prolyl oligopeptidase family serine peptidase [Clostridia bacterium]|nr:prolyl oligopeptidase family serine peptidase [Clostridia bacterium]